MLGIGSFTRGLGGRRKFQHKNKHTNTHTDGHCNILNRSRGKLSKKQIYQRKHVGRVLFFMLKFSQTHCPSWVTTIIDNILVLYYF